MSGAFKQPFPLPASPLCDLQTGIIADPWRQLLASLFARTGGAPGPALDLGRVASAAAAAAAAAADSAQLAALADVQQPPPDLSPLQAGQADLQALYALHDTADPAAAIDLGPWLAAQADLQAMAALLEAGEPAPAPDAAALLALVLAD